MTAQNDEAHYVVQAALELEVLLPLPIACWDYQPMVTPPSSYSPLHSVVKVI